MADKNASYKHLIQNGPKIYRVQVGSLNFFFFLNGYHVNVASDFNAAAIFLQMRESYIS